MALLEYFYVENGVHKMRMRIDRIDFVHDANCGKCNRRLTSGVAYILSDALGNDVAYGKKCAHDVAPNPECGIPDFTKAAIIMPVDETTGSHPQAVETRRAKEQKTSVSHTYLLAVEYLRLRVEGLHDFNVMPQPDVLQIYDVLKKNRFELKTVNEASLNYVWNVMDKCRRSVPKLSPHNLHVCYAYNFWLEKGITKISNMAGKKFLRSLQGQLKEKLSLSKGQIQGANKWFAGLKGMPQFKPDIFCKNKKTFE